ncbi:hypothetical protein DFJ73DRAFT_868280 [Zopfochytrium polystomum]|nr:hypothetical protein DFJ73DRAFT_868280 [Zopfochytrium polystomum]
MSSPPRESPAAADDAGNATAPTAATAADILASVAAQVNAIPASTLSLDQTLARPFALPDHIHAALLAARSPEANQYEAVVSYSRKDSATVYPLVDKLSANFRLWIDYQEGHTSVTESIVDGICQSAIFIPFLSDNYVSSLPCKLEIKLATEIQKPILPICLPNSEILKMSGASFLGSGRPCIDLQNGITYTSHSLIATRLSRLLKSGLDTITIKKDDIIFQEEDMIGEGSYGTVYKGVYLNRISVAVKSLKLRRLGEKAMAELVTEARILQGCRNPFIIGFYGVLVDGPRFSLVLEHASLGSLHDYYRSPTQKDTSLLDRVAILYQIAAGMTFLHDTLKLIHNDLKSHNVLLTHPHSGPFLAKITDFGLSNLKSETLAANGASGTTLWMAPELRSHPPKVSSANDVYSFSVLMTEVISWVGLYGREWMRITPDWVKWRLESLSSEMEREDLLEVMAAKVFDIRNNPFGTDLMQLFQLCWDPVHTKRPKFSVIAAELKRISDLIQGDVLQAQQLTPMTEAFPIVGSPPEYHALLGDVPPTNNLANYAWPTPNLPYQAWPTGDTQAPTNTNADILGRSPTGFNGGRALSQPTYLHHEHNDFAPSDGPRSFSTSHLQTSSYSFYNPVNANAPSASIRTPWSPLDKPYPIREDSLTPNASPKFSPSTSPRGWDISAFMLPPSAMTSNLSGFRGMSIVFTTTAGHASTAQSINWSLPQQPARSAVPSQAINSVSPSSEGSPSVRMITSPALRPSPGAGALRPAMSPPLRPAPTPSSATPENESSAATSSAEFLLEVPLPKSTPPRGSVVTNAAAKGLTGASIASSPPRRLAPSSGTEGVLKPTPPGPKPSVTATSWVTSPQLRPVPGTSDTRNHVEASPLLQGMQAVSAKRSMEGMYKTLKARGSNSAITSTLTISRPRRSSAGAALFQKLDPSDYLNHTPRESLLTQSQRTAQAGGDAPSTDTRNPFVLFIEALHYQFGVDCEVDVQKSAVRMKMMSESGKAPHFGHLHLAVMRSVGCGFPTSRSAADEIDLTRADADVLIELDAMEGLNASAVWHLVVGWTSHHAESGNPHAQFALGRYYWFGRGVSMDKSEAARLIRLAADQRLASAEHELGFMYGRGSGVSKDDGEAARWHRRAAEQGNASAQIELGWRLFNGVGVDQDRNEAMSWNRKAANQGNAIAQNNLGVMYLNGHGVEKDYGTAAQRNADAQNALGTLSYNGLGVPKDYEEALRWFRKAAEQRNALAEYNLGSMYNSGRGVARDFSAAAEWFRKAADQGNAEAQNGLGTLYYNGSGVEQDHNTALFWIRKAADKGNALAQFNLAVMHVNGRGGGSGGSSGSGSGTGTGSGSGNRDYLSAAVWFRKSALQGNADAQHSLASLYYTGTGLPRSLTDAAGWFRRAAQQGHANAQHSLATMLYKGEGVGAQSHAEAFEYFLLAAQQGHASAQNHCGRMYRDGIGVAANDSEAAGWFRAAAEQGNAMAQKSLGMLYRQGRGVMKSEQEARRWLKRAAEQGYEPAIQELATADDDDDQGGDAVA